MEDKIVFYATPYQGYYATRNGQILSMLTGKILRPKIDKDGYHEYALTINGVVTYKRGHRIIAETFLPNPQNKPTINHKDGNKANNCIDNLEWATYGENNLHRFQVLHCAVPNKWYIDIYYNGTIYETNCSLKDCTNAGISAQYLRDIRLGKENNFFYFFDMLDDNSIIVYWNGNIVHHYASTKEAAQSLGMKKACIYKRCKERKSVEYITKEYTFVFRDIVK